MKKIDLTGQRFGRLLVISEAAQIEKRVRWNCLCDCGNTKVVDSSNLRMGYTKSCGCLHTETTSKVNGTHHDSKSRLFHIWMSMKARCSNPRLKSYKNYGARGIDVCLLWRTSYESFHDWAVQHGYSDKLSIDRIDVNKGYTPENCRWTTSKEQCRNTRRNICFNGKCIAEWCEETGIDKRTVYQRIRAYKWPLEKAIFTPVNKTINTTKEINK